MCLNKLTAKREKIELDKLAEVFPCWKVIWASDHCQFDPSHRQPKLTRMTHVAEHFPAARLPLDYKVGFHAYLTKPTIKKTWCITPRSFKVIKCWARKPKTIICSSL